MPLEPFDWASAIIVTAIGGGLCGFALWGARERDLMTG
jgi:hypothetical protein